MGEQIGKEKKEMRLLFFILTQLDKGFERTDRIGMHKGWQCPDGERGGAGRCSSFRRHVLFGLFRNKTPPDGKPPPEALFSAFIGLN